MPRKYPNKLMRGRGQKNGKRQSKTNKKNLTEQNLMLYREKQIKLSSHKKAFHKRALKSLNNIKDSTFSYEMAMRFDSLYLEDAKSVSAKDIKIRGLKELNLIHLDLLQQQADQINERDKRIQILEEENKNIRARLDRIDRRISVNINKKISNVEPLIVDTCISREKIKLVDSETQTLPNLSPIGNHIINSKFSYEEIQEDELNSLNFSPKSNEPIKSWSLNSSQALRTSPREKRNKKDKSLLIENSQTLITDYINKNILSETKRGICKKTKLSPSVEIIPDIDKKDITNHSLRSRDKQKEFGPTDNISDYMSDQKDVSENIEVSFHTSTPILTPSDPPSISEEKYINKANDLPSSVKNCILTTEVPYFLATPHHPFVNCLSSTDESSLEIPKWRIKNLFPLYVMEGTENLGEDIFTKRHGKPEHDERRRKRWDLQRLREQRQYEKLRQRYDSRHNTPGVSPGSNLSLWPNCDMLLSVCVESELPVCAFGQPLTVFNHDCFSVPWLSKNIQITPRKKPR